MPKAEEKMREDASWNKLVNLVAERDHAGDDEALYQVTLNVETAASCEILRGLALMLVERDLDTSSAFSQLVNMEIHDRVWRFLSSSFEDYEFDPTNLPRFVGDQLQKLLGGDYDDAIVKWQHQRSRNARE